MSEPWQQYDYETISALKKITATDDKEVCLALIESAKDSSEFLSHIRELIAAAGGKLHDGKECPKFEKMTEGEFKNLPWQPNGKNLWEAMNDMPPVDACRPGLWLHITLSAIESGAIESHYLAFGKNGGDNTGLAHLDKAHNSPDELVKDAPRYLEACRRILRHAFGAISERGTKGIFVEVPFAKTWWQRYIAEEIARGEANIAADKMTNFLSQENRKYIYAELTRCMSSSLTAIGDQPVRDGLMHCWFHAIEEEAAIIKTKTIKEKQPPSDFTDDSFKKMTKQLGIMLAWRAMGTLSVLENSEISYQCVKDKNIKENPNET